MPSLSPYDLIFELAYDLLGEDDEGKEVETTSATFCPRTAALPYFCELSDHAYCRRERICLGRQMEVTPTAQYGDPGSLPLCQG